MPDDGTIVAPFGLDTLMLYVVPLQIPALKLAPAPAHCVVQSTGCATVTDVLQPPVALVAVITTLVVLLVTVTMLPLTVAPAPDTVTVAPALMLMATV